jgi:DNA replication protein DnaC
LVAGNRSSFKSSVSRDESIVAALMRYDRRSTLITSQLPVEQWHAYLEDPTLADAILDRLIHNSYRLPLKGDSMRKQKSTVTAKPTQGH